MAVVGIAVRTKGGRPWLKGVVARCEGESVEVFDHLATQGLNSADQVHELAQAFHTHVVGIEDGVEALVVREADDGQRGGLTAARKTRARAEGAVVHVARGFTGSVHIMNGPQIGRGVGGNLADAEASAAPLVANQFVDACSAAVVALQLACPAD